MTIKVLLVDDHEMVRMGLAGYLDIQADIEVVGEAASGEEGVRLAGELKPDVVVMDLVMAGMGGVEATRLICEMPDAPQVIVLTSFMDDDKVYPVIEAGALSYLLKTSRAREIASAIRAAGRGDSVLEAEVTGKVLSRMRRAPQDLPYKALTSREIEVLSLIAKGKTNHEIAAELVIAVKTVKTHITNIFAKLEVDDRTQAAVYVHRNGPI
ncbi:response regulator [Paenibacillus nasutitermitis]|uniref:Transcriptional regulatory protein LiaR n=1 Tax=Paenibacillus nasutitermitis TaxID=1652958 RepID=A0A916YS22_9BACL|nr:response regulator transcription factor [Paenibacillus nasutitermitis]GGD58397.1 transcriptional regulatory protein LiaR [Paenibacillus nasutitermitis]